MCNPTPGGFPIREGSKYNPFRKLRILNCLKDFFFCILEWTVPLPFWMAVKYIFDGVKFPS